jgi:hypothetical protein
MMEKASQKGFITSVVELLEASFASVFVPEGPAKGTGVPDSPVIGPVGVPSLSGTSPAAAAFSAFRLRRFVTAYT